MGDVNADVIGSQSKAGILGFGGLPASCEAVLKTGSWRKDGSIEKFRENSSLGKS